MSTMIFALAACLCSFLIGRLSVGLFGKKERPEDAATSSDL
jgi:hypothetical protein